MTEEENIESRRNSQRKYYNKNKQNTRKEPVTEEEKKERKREYYQKNKQKIKEHYEKNKQIINKKHYQNFKEKHGVEKLRQIQSGYYLARCEREPAYRVHLRETALRRYHQKKLEGIPKKLPTRRRGKPRTYEPLLITDAPPPTP